MDTYKFLFHHRQFNYINFIISNLNYIFHKEKQIVARVGFEPTTFGFCVSVPPGTTRDLRAVPTWLAHW